VFVLTHHPRPTVTMQGGTTLHFVDDGIEAALERAFEAALGRPRAPAPRVTPAHRARSSSWTVWTSAISSAGAGPGAQTSP
jgi:hypothetical protein